MINKVFSGSLSWENSKFNNKSLKVYVANMVSHDGWRDKQMYVFITECYSTVKRNKVLIHVVSCINLKNNKPTLQHKYYMI